MSDDPQQNVPPGDQPEAQFGPTSQQGPPPPPPPGPPSYQPPPYQAAPPGGPYYYPPPPPPPARPRRWLIPVIIIAAIALPLFFLAALFAGGFMAAFGSFGESGTSISGDHIALVRVSGVITAGRSGGSPFGGENACGSEDLIAQLEKARKDDDAKAILIRINSPGGSAAGSEEVYNEIRRITRTGKPVYASMGDVAASGGYYIASACDKIYADGGTLTGSIGVIFQTTDMSALFKKIGFSPEVVKSGKFKDIGSPNRALTPEERALLQAMINDIYGRFVKAVSDGRHLPEADVKKIADGRIFTGSQAVKAKLVDEVGGMHEATRAVARAAGMSGEPRLKEYQKRGLFSALFGEDADSSSQIDRAVSRELVNQFLRGNLPTR